MQEFYLKQVADRDLKERYSKMALLVDDYNKMAKNIMLL